MNLSWANQFAKSALKTAQQKIDSVLDIRPDEQSSSTVVLDDPLLTPVPEDAPPEGTVANLFAVSDTGQPDTWGSAWGGLPSDPELVVDSEPNPIRDEDHNVSHLLDHSPSSNSSDAVDSHGSPVKNSDYADVDLHEEESKDSNSPITCEPLFPPHHSETASLPGYHHDDTLTVASSDIEIIRNVDAWSVSSSRITNDHLPVPAMGTKGEATDALEAQLQMAEQRRKELKTSNDVLQKTNLQLQQRIVILNQQQNQMKKELEDKKKECEDLLVEGKKISDYSGKQSREIRRLKNELSDLEKIKAERKRYKDEKTQAEETIELQKEEIANLKNMIKTLELASEQMKKDNSQNVASNEAVQKHIEVQDRRINDLEAEVKRLNAEKDSLEESNRDLSQEMEHLHATQWADRLAGERANETALTVGQDLSEAREQIERLTSQLNFTRIQLENALEQQSSIAETIAKANSPLLDELRELKNELANEQQIAEDCDKKARQAKKEYENLKKQLSVNEEKHSQTLLMLRTEMESMLKKHSALETEITRIRQEKQQNEDEFKASRHAYEERMQKMHNEILEAGEEANNLRKNLKEFKEDNDQLRAELSELRRTRDVTPSPSQAPTASIVKPDLPVDVPPLTSSPNFVPMSYSFANSGQAAQVELEALSSQYETSLKRIAFLEGETKRNQQLEVQIRTLQRELKELNHHYNQLLELDGERLEKLEEQAHDIIDLRNLLKDQLIAFADAKSREEEEKKKDSISSD